MSQEAAGAQARQAMAGARAGQPDAPPGPVQECATTAAAGPPASGVEPPPDGTPKQWIGLVLVDEEGRPVPDVAWRVVAADGEVFTGVLDGTGTAHIPALAPGPAKISFPKLDGRAWSPA